MSTGARARVRAELTREIADVARRHLASAGAAALSLRAVARELGMASSAVYRYYPSRDELLTALIVDAYDALGDAAERADAACGRDDLRGRWHATCGAARDWALAHPHEYALLYGTPVPGYAAPQATTGPAARVGEVLARILVDGLTDGPVDGAAPSPEEDGGVLHPDIPVLLGLPAPLAARAIATWTALFGLISFELFGHTRGVVVDHAGHFAHELDRLATAIGLP